MKRSRRTKNIEDIRGYSKSESRGNPNGEGLYGKSSTTEKRLRKQAAARENQEQPICMEKETNTYKLMSTA
jgi:hypothetical protein